ncbi:hypothetical protein GCM10022219_11650 [Microbacterium oryzae]|uniref:hypothetical protein n=1 Tax=Microbacterium oryzae TaxID=743009 RepID=UPI0012E23C59|nr:hypothetical protein [Microbacterium oryzae]
MTAGRYTAADIARYNELEREFEIIRAEEERRVSENPWGRLRTGVRRIGFQPNPQN